MINKYENKKVTCGSGTKSRSRECPGGSVGIDCFGNEIEKAPCYGLQI